MSAARTLATAASTPQSYFRIYLRRSAIGLPEKQKGVLAALGLRKRTSTVYHPVSPDVAGQIFRVKELVDVQEVEKPMSKAEQKAARTPEPGYYVERRAGEGRHCEKCKVNRMWRETIGEGDAQLD